MRFIYIYLIGYFVLIAGAGIALWQGGVLARIAPFWLFVTSLIVVGLGLLLAVTSTRQAASTPE